MIKKKNNNNNNGLYWIIYNSGISIKKL